MEQTWKYRETENANTEMYMQTDMNRYTDRKYQRRDADIYMQIEHAIKEGQIQKDRLKT